MDETEQTVQEHETKQPLLIPEENYLSSGVHIGTQQKSADMKRFLFKVRSDGLYMLDFKLTDQRIRIASQFLSRFSPDEILVVSARQYGQKPVRTFAKKLGAFYFAGRFVPGTLTNPRLADYIEPQVLLVTDPAADQQAVREAINAGIPIIGLCDANNETRNMDVIIPANNKGRRALATVYWLLTREYLKNRNLIKSDEEFDMAVEDFEATI
ncbi:MAG: 30S ribosomal protein S2 [Candidatus Thermoplasmatota archaeon]|nr:30S ribosomal protein S2 [Euryarchaeota archaeon]MBU4032480.1 30S ribosomal protein S2 [Candidatus Thermoplasmatota archaeon]MBU4072132.1 30S ribosomal protein S2 [Candidatus Thermoplasmatota archaeon]MBU4143534.1 30S ribosomal protein S2 [Candidatus Thermoplasmatota archaeon]MBU4591947.1 30S ribosomal protein S2 [Candidatus Thermoplasmatota archaeon]